MGMKTVMKKKEMKSVVNMRKMKKVKKISKMNMVVKTRAWANIECNKTQF